MTIKVQYWFFLVILCFLFAGCGNSDNNRKKEEEKLNELRQKELDDKRDKQTKNLLEKYHAIYFPPKEINSNSNSLQIQRFFEKNKTVLFSGFFEDIVKEGEDIIVVLTCKTGNILDETAILYKLVLPQYSDTIFQEEKTNVGIIWAQFTDFGYSDYQIVCDSLSITKVYENDKPLFDQDNENNYELKITHIVFGKLISAEKTPK